MLVQPHPSSPASEKPTNAGHIAGFLMARSITSGQSGNNSATHLPGAVEWGFCSQGTFKGLFCRSAFCAEKFNLTCFKEVRHVLRDRLRT
jgi:hypothetical protein